MPAEEQQIAECDVWARLLMAAGYVVSRTWTNHALDYFSYVYKVDHADGSGQVATFDIDGCGASWHGPDDLWLEVIGKHVGVFA